MPTPDRVGSASREATIPVTTRDDVAAAIRERHGYAERVPRDPEGKSRVLGPILALRFGLLSRRFGGRGRLPISKETAGTAHCLRQRCLPPAAMS
jgi:hypothetical protein